MIFIRLRLLCPGLFVFILIGSFRVHAREGYNPER